MSESDTPKKLPAPHTVVRIPVGPTPLYGREKGRKKINMYGDRIPITDTSKYGLLN
jgi:hypothetical protein